MTRIRAIVLAAAASALVAIPVAAAPAKSGKKSLKVGGGATTLALDAGTAQTLTDLGISVAPLSPARVGNDGVAFPVTNGKLDRKSYAGKIKHVGGLRLAGESTTVDLRNFTIRVDDAPDLTAIVGDTRLSIADLDLSGAEITATKKRVRIEGVVVKLTQGAADALDAAFGTTAFEPGLVLGEASVSTKIRGK